MIGPTLLAFAMLPSVAISGLGEYFAKRKLTIGIYAAGFLLSICTYTLISTWCGAISYYYLDHARSSAFWPLLIWTYGVATAPWSYMAQRNQSPGSFLAAFFTQVGFIVVMIALAFGVNLEEAFQLFALVMIAGVFFHMRFLAEAGRAALLVDEWS